MATWSNTVSAVALGMWHPVSEAAGCGYLWVFMGIYGYFLDEERLYGQAPSRARDVRHDIRWLSAGQTFEL